ncbi:PilN domain-containing protein [Leptothermofonsia sp. ETS-13]|uniref:PilN domain-containing protein n=1 Tax=Leptothermofonsia sp. ETS-13 TaxID=3035696 RepID=UPI003BA35B3F
MHSLDINFLNDRPEYRPDGGVRTRGARAVPTDSRQPLILGLLAAILLPALAGGLLLFLQSRNADLEQRQVALDSQLGDIQAKQKQIESLRTETKQVKEETLALASVFNTLKPWSAVMQDFRDRIPPGVQILRVKQLPVQQGQPQPSPSPSPSPGATPGAPTPPVIGNVEISGIANSFNDVNDFMLVLQKSAFLDPKETRLVASELQQTAPTLSTLQLKNAPVGTVDTNNLPKLPSQIEFTIRTAFNNIPASDLLQELERKTAVGLVTRIEELQRKGVIQK